VGAAEVSVVETPFSYIRPADSAQSDPHRTGADRPRTVAKKEMRKFVGGKPRAISDATYKAFARKYGIKTGGPVGQTAQKIYNYENRTGVQKGLYFQPKK